MKTVLCHGVFDVLHAGHLAYFQEAKKYGERLVVSITEDRFVRKGPGRPYFNSLQRKGMLGSIKLIDEVWICDDSTALPAIERYAPDFYVKGPDYLDASKDLTGEILNEKAAVEKHGGKLVFTTGEMHSSSTLINKFFNQFSEEQRASIERIKALGGYGAIEKAINALEGFKLAVVGEPIIDVYRFCRPESISSKSPTISARFTREETYFGGTSAIAKHLESFCNVRLLSPLTSSRVYPSKIRYIDEARSQRIFEVTEIWEHEWDKENYVARLEGFEADCFVIADFGHGLIEGPVLEAIGRLKGYVGLNVQTNSSNFGFNVYTKHGRFDYLCLDTREARLAEHDRYSDPLAIAHRIHGKRKRRPTSITLGSNGSILLDQGIEFKSPAFSDVVIDATGAGDAYFAITTVLMATGCRQEFVPFIGNVFAGLKTKILGNKESVSKASLLKAVKALLA